MLCKQIFVIELSIYFTSIFAYMIFINVTQTLLQNSFRISVNTTLGKRYVEIIFTIIRATLTASLFGTGYAIGHLENKSVQVSMYLFPL